MQIKTLKIILSILLFACLIDFPYGYFQFVRYIAMICFGFFAYNNFEEQKDNIAVGFVDWKLKYYKTFYYLFLVILFQPFIKIALGRTIWNIVDVVVGIGLLLSLNKTK